jgi:hypothetical protein
MIERHPILFRNKDESTLKFDEEDVWVAQPWVFYLLFEV